MVNPRDLSGNVEEEAEHFYWCGVDSYEKCLGPVVGNTSWIVMDELYV